MYLTQKMKHLTWKIFYCFSVNARDAALAIAHHVGGSVEEFVTLMNNKAKEIGMTNSHFVTASGLHDDDHYSTCEDMALALKYAIATPELREILGTYTYRTSKTPEHPEGILLFSTMYTKMKSTVMLL